MSTKMKTFLLSFLAIFLASTMFGGLQVEGTKIPAGVKDVTTPGYP